MLHGKRRWIAGIASAITVLALATLVVTLVFGGGRAAYASSGSSGDGIGAAKFLTEAPTNFSANATTIPYFRSSFTDPTNGVTYPYTMVGSDPSKGDATTTIPTVIIPFRFTFANSASSNNVLDGADRVQATIQSPVFQSADIGTAANSTASAPPDQAGVAPSPRVVNEPSDNTQLGDAIYRAQWGKSGSNYHVLLGQPTVTATQNIAVPSNQGSIVIGSRSHARIGLMSYSWFSSKLINAINQLHISPTTLPIILVDNTFLYIGDPSNCCVLGYHGAKSSLNGNGKQQVQTYMFGSYTVQGVFASNPGDSDSYIADIHGLSHEVQEWLDDPFVNNAVNPWLTPTAPQYGCTSDLETGDPVVGFGFKVSMPNGITYHPEDEVHYSWFARESPSRAEQGYYTYLNNFADVAHGC